MIASLSKAFAQLSDPAFRSVLLRSLVFSVIAFGLVWFGAWWGLEWVESALTDSLGTSGSWWAETLLWLAGAVSFAAILIASFFVFPAVTAIIMGLLLDEIAEAVERRHYPGLPEARDPPVIEGVIGSLGFLGITLLANLIVLPLYLIPGANLFVFYTLNGYLLGREYFELVAIRRLERNALKQLRRRYRGRVFFAGVVIAFLLTIPLVNLITPIVATGFMVHIFESLRQRGPAMEGAAA